MGENRSRPAAIGAPQSTKIGLFIMVRQVCPELCRRARHERANESARHFGGLSAGSELVEGPSIYFRTNIKSGHYRRTVAEKDDQPLGNVLVSAQKGGIRGKRDPSYCPKRFCLLKRSHN